MRASESVLLLSEILASCSELDTDNSSNNKTAHYYFSAAALVKIGNPSIDTMLSKIKYSKNELERELASWVIMEIEGKEQAIYRFGKLKEREKNYAEQFDSAIKYIENYKVTFGNPKNKPKGKENEDAPPLGTNGK
jgi:hypothetical protein